MIAEFANRTLQLERLVFLPCPLLLVAPEQMTMEMPPLRAGGYRRCLVEVLVLEQALNRQAERRMRRARQERVLEEARFLILSDQ